MSYKLSYTAQEVDELLTKVKGGVCLPVVELETIPTAEGAALTESEAAVMTGVLANKTPVIVKFNDSRGGFHSAMLSYAGMDGLADVFNALDITGSSVQQIALLFIDNAWVFAYGEISSYQKLD